MASDDTGNFTVSDHGTNVDSVVAGFAAYGLAGLTAAEYLADHLELEPTGHVTSENLPAITPFEDGRPHHHTRILTRPDLDVAVLHGSLFVPTWAAGGFSEAILDWTDRERVDEVTVLSGVPMPHTEAEHKTFHVATADYHDRRLASADPAVPGMPSGFLDGVNAALVERGMLSDLAVAVLVTPVHDRVPDVEAAIRLVDTVTDLHDLDVDTGPLEAFAADVETYYTELHERLQSMQDDTASHDRMFM
jgi:uncharacterized protein